MYSESAWKLRDAAEDAEFSTLDLTFRNHGIRTRVKNHRCEYRILGMM
jgi:hypothetical protein